MQYIPAAPDDVRLTCKVDDEGRRYELHAMGRTVELDQSVGDALARIESERNMLIARALGTIREVERSPDWVAAFDLKY
jgi:hypothetical protein